MIIVGPITVTIRIIRICIQVSYRLSYIQCHTYKGDSLQYIYKKTSLYTPQVILYKA